MGEDTLSTQIEGQTPKGPARRKTSKKAANGTDLLTLILTSLEDDKAEDIVSIDLDGKTSIADDMIVASGRSARHVGALAEHIVEKLKESGAGTAKVEGLPNCDWVLIDAGDVIVHLFRPEVRDFYKIEKLWSGEAEPKAATA